MSLGKKIKRIRNVRGLTQRELGLKLGYEKGSADIRIAQYETGCRTPKKETRIALAKILEVAPANFLSGSLGSEEEMVQMLLWMAEEERDMFHFFQVSPPLSTGEQLVKSDTCCENGCATDGMIGIGIGCGHMNGFLSEWMKQKERLNEGQITELEYLDWKWRVQ